MVIKLNEWIELNARNAIEIRRSKSFHLDAAHSNCGLAESLT